MSDKFPCYYRPSLMERWLLIQQELGLLPRPHGLEGLNDGDVMHVDLFERYLEDPQ